MLAVIITLKLVASAACLLCAWLSYGAMNLMITDQLDAATLHIRSASQQRAVFKIIFGAIAVIMLAGIWVAP